MKPTTTLPFLRMLLLAAMLSPLTVPAQSPITSFSASYVSTGGSLLSYLDLPALLSGAFSGCTSTSYTYSYGNGSSNQCKLNSFNANGSTYLVAPAFAGAVKLRRVNNANATGSRSILYMETTASSALACPTLDLINCRPPYIDLMEDLLNAANLNQGTDNVFTNTGNGDGNNNNIERVDVIFAGSLNTASPSEAGFAIFDRGNIYQHDAFRIAAITGLDAAGNPSSFGPVRTCIPGNGSNSNGSWGHPSTANGNRLFPCYVLRKDPGQTHLRVSSNVNQEIGGVFYAFADLGIGSGQPLYGYALLGPDGLANPGSAQLLDLSNTAVYPTSTTEAAGGGLDLVAVNTVFATGTYVVLPLAITGFTGNIDNGQARLQWELQNAAGGEDLQIQRSDDGIAFTTIGNAAGTAFTDRTMPPGGSYYRLEVTNTSGFSSYSRVLLLHGAGTATMAGMKVYPSLTDGDRPLALEGLPDGLYTASFYDMGGRRTSTKVQVVNRHSWISWPAGSRTRGLYRLTLTGNDGSLAGSSTILLR